MAVICWVLDRHVIEAVLAALPENCIQCNRADWPVLDYCFDWGDEASSTKNHEIMSLYKPCKHRAEPDANRTHRSVAEGSLATHFMVSPLQR